MGNIAKKNISHIFLNTFIRNTALSDHNGDVVTEELPVEEEVNAICMRKV